MARQAESGIEGRRSDEDQRQDLSAIIIAEKCGTALGNNTKLCGESAAKNGNSAAKVRRKTGIVRRKCGEKRKLCGKSAAKTGIVR
jgi:hypothetical protein